MHVKEQRLWSRYEFAANRLFGSRREIAGGNRDSGLYP